MDWSAVWLEYHGRIIAYIYNHTHEWLLAEDLASETFLRALKSESEGNGPNSSLSGWLFCIARNLILDTHRYRLRHRTAQLEAVDIEWPISEYASLEEYMVKADLLGRIDSVVKGLSEQQRAVAALRNDGHAFREIGEMLGKSEKAVKSSQHLTLVHIRNSIGVTLQ